MQQVGCQLTLRDRRAHMVAYGLLFVLLCFQACAAEDAEVAFSPRQGATELVIKAISEAHKSIRVAAYSFTSRPIAQALVEAHRRGIDVRVVLDKSNRNGGYSLANALAQAGIPTRIDGRYAIMHSKYMVIDDSEIELGSFNYTNAAEKNNAENVLIVRRSPALANAYKANWQHLWDESEVVDSRQ